MKYLQATKLGASPAARWMSIAAILGLLIFAVPSANADTTWDLSSGGSCNLGAGAGTLDCDGTDGTDGNERVFTAGTETVRARAFSSATSTGGNFGIAFLGQYSGGLGVTNSTESSSDPHHGVDNAGRDDLVVFMFQNSSFIATGLHLGWVSGDSDLDVWIGGNTKTWSDFTALSFATLAANGFTKYSESCSDVSTTSTSERSVNLNKNCPVNPANLSGKFLVVAARNEVEAGGADGGEDSFKIETMTAKQNNVPEPAGLVLLGLGLGALAIMRRRAQ